MPLYDKATVEGSALGTLNVGVNLPKSAVPSLSATLGEIEGKVAALDEIAKRLFDIERNLHEGGSNLFIGNKFETVDRTAPMPVEPNGYLDRLERTNASFQAKMVTINDIIGRIEKLL